MPDDVFRFAPIEPKSEGAGNNDVAGNDGSRIMALGTMAL